MANLPSGEIEQIIPADGWYAHFEGSDRGVPLVAWALVRREHYQPAVTVVGLIVPMHKKKYERVLQCEGLSDFVGYSRIALGKPET